MTSPFRHFIRSLGWILIVILGFEVLLRLTVLDHRVGYIYDPQWGSRRTGGSSIRWGLEGYGVTRFSSLGEIETPFSGGAEVVVLGDSHTEGLQVGSEANFVSVAETLLRARGIPADLRNLADSGLDLPDYVYQIPLLLKSGAPRGFVIQLTTGDVLPPDRDATNRFSFIDENRFEIAHTPPVDLGTPKRRAIQSLSLLDYGLYRFKEITTRAAAGTAGAAGSGAFEEQAFRRNARRQLLALSSVLSDVPTILILLPFHPRIEGRTIRLTARDFEILVEEASRIPKWKILDPSATFNRMASQGRFPRGFPSTSPPGTGHLNVAGHRELGTLLAEQLVEILK